MASSKAFQNALQRLRSSHGQPAREFISCLFHLVENLTNSARIESERLPTLLMDERGTETFQTLRREAMSEVESAFSEFGDSDAVWKSIFSWDSQFVQVPHSESREFWDTASRTLMSSERRAAGETTFWCRAARGDEYETKFVDPCVDLSAVQRDFLNPAANRKGADERIKKVLRLLELADAKVDRIRDWQREIYRLDLLDGQYRVNGSLLLVRCHAAWKSATEKRDIDDMELLCRQIDGSTSERRDILVALQELVNWSQENSSKRPSCKRHIEDPFGPPPKLTKWEDLVIGVDPRKNPWEFWAFVPPPEVDKRVTLSSGNEVGIPMGQLGKTIGLFATSEHGNCASKRALENAFGGDELKKRGFCFQRESQASMP